MGCLIRNVNHLNTTFTSLSKLSVESDACMMFSVKPRPKSPLIEPGSASNDFVAPTICLVVVTALFPSTTVTTTGPDVIYSNNSPKKGLSLWIE